MTKITEYTNPYENMPTRVPERIKIGNYIFEEIIPVNGKLVIPSYITSPKNDFDCVTLKAAPQKCVKKNIFSKFLKSADKILRAILL